MWRQLRRDGLADGGKFPIEIDITDFEGEQVARDEDEVIYLRDRLTPALALIRPVAQDVIKDLERLTPDEIQVQFSVNIYGEIGALMTKAGVKGKVVVTVFWRH